MPSLSVPTDVSCDGGAVVAALCLPGRPCCNAAARPGLEVWLAVVLEAAGVNPGCLHRSANHRDLAWLGYVNGVVVGCGKSEAIMEYESGSSR